MRRQRGRRTRLTITLTPQERQTLHAWQRAPTIAAGKARRGRIILLLAAGVSITESARMVGISRRFVYKWVARFQAQGVDGLVDDVTQRRGRGRGTAALVARAGGDDDA